MRRRSFLAAAGSLPLLELACARGEGLPFDGAFVGQSLDLGHAARDVAFPAPTEFQNVDVVIVGGGIAGLSAAWRLEGVGFRDYLLLELESGVGGTSRAGRNGISAYPLAAHYVPAPSKDVRALLRLLQETGVVEGCDAQGEPVFAEQHLVRAPEERIFHAGQWWEGLYLHAGASVEDQRQYRAFFAEVDRWVAWRDPQGRRAFTLPRAAGSEAVEVRALDTQSFARWLADRGFTSERLLWLLDYAVRDDFGSKLDTTSAWAGLFYFAARKQGPGEESRPLLTWPEGNGFLVAHLRRSVAPRVREGHAVSRISPGPEGRWEVQAWTSAEGRPAGFRARRIIFAAPVQVAGRAIPDLARERGKAFFQAFQASPWLVANLTLRDRPKEHGFPLAWDNVIRESPGLGYVVATHQALKDHGPTVWTYYHAFSGRDIGHSLRSLAGLSWAQAARLVLSDLERAHPNLRRHITRMDIARWGHAMIRPRPGLLFSPELAMARRPWRGIHFAHTDLSGFALFEEAQDHGLRAAEEVLAALGSPSGSWR